MFGASLQHFDSRRVAPSRNSYACFSHDLPSPSGGKPVRRGGQRRLLSALSFTICMSHPAAAPGSICNAHTTPPSANTHVLHARVVIRWCSLPLTRTEPFRFILRQTGIVYDFGSHKQTNARNVLRRRASRLFFSCFFFYKILHLPRCLLDIFAHVPATPSPVRAALW